MRNPYNTGTPANKQGFTSVIFRYCFHFQMQNHISFLHEELIKLPAFPRKALDAEFALYQGSLGNVSQSIS